MKYYNINFKINILFSDGMGLQYNGDNGIVIMSQPDEVSDDRIGEIIHETLRKSGINFTQKKCLAEGKKMYHIYKNDPIINHLIILTKEQYELLIQDYDEIKSTKTTPE